MTILQTLLYAYYIVFVVDTHPDYMRRAFQRQWVYDTAKEVALSDATLEEGVRLMEIPVHESGYDKTAVGKLGERGRWQVRGGKDFGARAALGRLRMGMVSFVGCQHASDVVVVNGARTTCQAMIDRRVGPADAYVREHPFLAHPPRDEVDNEEASR